MFSPDGSLNVPEYGDLKNQQGFKNLLEISAYDHVADGTHYPAILLTTGRSDPRVVPWEPGKMAIRLKAASDSGKPMLLRVDDLGRAWRNRRNQESNGRTCRRSMEFSFVAIR
jgi:prolyl oligopeptidase